MGEVMTSKHRISSDSFLAINHGVIQELGSLHAAALIAALREHRTKLLHGGKLPEDGWFFFQRHRMEQVILLKRSCIADHMETLINRDLVRLERRGQNRNAYYLLNDDAYEQVVRFGMSRLASRDKNIANEDTADAEKVDQSGLTEIRETDKPKNGLLSKKDIYKKDINTSTKYLNEPSGSMKPPKQKPQPIQPDPYQCMTPKRTDPPLVKSVQIPKHIAPIVERWFEVGRRHGPTTKVLRDGVRAVKGVLAGTFFDKPGYRNQIRYSQAEVLRSLDTFNLKRNSPDHQPIKKDFLKDLNLADFFYSQYARNGNGNGGGSIFLQCLEGRAVPAVECHPELTAFALDKYEDETGKTLDHAGAARIANKMMRYWNEKDEWLKQRGIATPKRLVVAWFGMLESRRGGDWDAGNVLSQNAVGAFESYLKEQHTGR